MPIMSSRPWEQITDVEAKGYYEEHIRKEPAEKVFRDILAGTREHARVLLPWNRKLPPCHEGLYQKPKKEVLAAYKKLLGLRHREKAFVYGSFRVLSRRKDRFVYVRALEGRTFVVDCNLSPRPCRPYRLRGRWRLVYDTLQTCPPKRLNGQGKRGGAQPMKTGITGEETGGKRPVKGMLQGYEARIMRLER